MGPHRGRPTTARAPLTNRPTSPNPNNKVEAAGTTGRTRTPPPTTEINKPAVTTRHHDTVNPGSATPILKSEEPAVLPYGRFWDWVSGRDLAHWFGDHLRLTAKVCIMFTAPLRRGAELTAAIAALSLGLLAATGSGPATAGSGRLVGTSVNGSVSASTKLFPNAKAIRLFFTSDPEVYGGKMASCPRPRRSG